METGPARIALIGANGFGFAHRRNIARLEQLGRAALVALAEPAPLEPGDLSDTVRVYTSAHELLAAEPALDVVIVSSPLHTHFDIALAVIDYGADLYLEKPPVTSLGQFDRLKAAAMKAEQRVQVGFQSLGSLALPWLRHAIENGSFGDVRAVTAAGVWTRDRAYFSRSRWSGRRTLDDQDVVDGVATNALSHAVATALAVAGALKANDIEGVEVDLHRANSTESDDTTVVRVRRKATEPDVTCALTLCGPDEAQPAVTVHGSVGSATFHYVLDQVRVRTDDDTRTDSFGRTDLLENLLDARAGLAELLSPLEAAEAYMNVLEAVRISTEPRSIAERFVDRVGSGPAERLVVRNIEEAIARSCAAEATFSELGLPWVASDGVSEAVLRAVGRPVAEFRSGATVARSLVPRPYLHPVRTLAGVPLTDHFPLDHVWHLGVGVAMPDVNGTNLWGGPDYRDDIEGYRWHPTHGTIRAAAETDVRPDRIDQQLIWWSHDGKPLIHETREWASIEVDESTWRLDLRFTLSSIDGPVMLGSPGSRGRNGAGYGGFFWRFAPCRQVRVRTVDAEGEAAANGSHSPWLHWEAEFDGAAASVHFSASESNDPWFVRIGDYPGVGSALAWDSPLVLNDRPVTRMISAVIRDGADGLPQVLRLGL